MKTALTVVIAVVIVAVVGVGAFFAGTSYGQAQAQNTRAQFFRSRGIGTTGATGGQSGQAGQNGQGTQFGRPAAFGTVKSVSGNTVVVTQQDGSTVTVTLNSQTQIQKTVSGTTSDIQPGDRVTITSDQTGSNIVARSVQIRPNGAQQ
ncbi:MAG: hypothetical protein M1570_17360 [Chloroflexi bacterium]|nr:hypothetical protein [Chloroflexota bacterium]